MTNNRRVLSVFSLVMINVIAVDNLRSLPISAEYGFSLVFYYILAALVFFIPSALVSAELATGWPQRGGVYIWVREAFGNRCAFLAIWLQWIYNVVWYPTILAFLAGIFAYLLDPNLANNKVYILSFILGSFWLATIANAFGMKISGLVSTIGALIGTIIPMLFICILGVFWLSEHNHSNIVFSTKSFFPNLNNFDNLTFLTGVVFGLMGMEMSAVHAEEVRNPQRDYPRALLYSTIIILITLIAASLAIAIAVPHNQISLVSGLLQAFSIFFDKYHLHWLIPIIAIAVVIGGFGGVSAWVIGPTKGLLVASYDGSIPPVFHKINKADAPIALLVSQAVIVTILCGIFLLMPSVNSSYWILSALTAQLALLFYIFLFAAAIKLRYSHPNVARTYKIPGGNFSMWLVSGVAIIACIAVIIFGFLPPTNLQVGSLYFYEGFLIVGIVVFCLLPFLIYRLRKPEWVNQR